jgi:energy coupling factor transporter S component ThiW
MNTKKMVFSALLIAIGTLTANIIYIPVGVAKCFPIQHTINVLSAVLLGPWYAVANAAIIALLRNMLGVGSLLAFPGGMIGALLAGLLYAKFKKIPYALCGEIFGTGILGGILSFPIAKFVLGQNVLAYTFIVPFLISTIGGSVVAYLILKCMDWKKYKDNLKN